MNDKHLARLIEAHLEGSLDETTHAELERVLLESESARRQFWEHAAVHGQLHEVAKLRWSSAREGLPPPRLFWRSLWTRLLRPASLGFATLLIGAVSGSLLYAQWTAVRGVDVPLDNAGFESSRHPGTNGFPDALAAWSGDDSRIVQAELGISPRSGSRMLRFLSPVARSSPPAAGFTVSDQWMLLDAHQLPAMTAGTVLVLSASFNRAPDSTTSNNRFGVALYAFKGSTEQGAKLWDQYKARALAFAETEVQTDDDAVTWERGEVRLKMPPHADLLLVRIHAFRDTVDTAALNGHYADDVRLEAMTP